ncbi:alpha-1-acid glycoprotein 1-like [Choloepus didactylus]|uniref:alpha-1-acid glycoprotein 1-like n=1 Tax=Choloepus didactylus TaxID=27675 RepID=UPI00189FC2D9|nr:alpha-1-acid glycoprotein 1-like [Choloepus didactylus]
MALPWALTALSLLPLLTAQDPTCPYQKAVPITDAILERLSGKWFYIAGVFRNPELQRLIRDVKATFFYLTPNLKEDTIQLRDYETIGDECHYSVNSRDVQRQNGTLSRTVPDGVQIVHLWLSKDPKAFILLFEPEDEQNRGLAFYARKQKVTKKQLREFQEALKCLGLQDDEILYLDGKKDLCRPLDKQHKKERKKGNVES